MGDPAFTLEMFHVVMTVVGMLLTGIGTLGGVVYFLLGTIKSSVDDAVDGLTKADNLNEERLTSKINVLDTRLTDNFKIVHEKIDGKSQHLDNKIDKRVDVLAADIEKIEDRSREDIKEQRIRLDNIVDFNKK